MTQIEISADKVDGLIERLQGHGGWQLRYLASRGHWIELHPDARSARTIIETPA